MAKKPAGRTRRKRASAARRPATRSRKPKARGARSRKRVPARKGSPAAGRRSRSKPATRARKTTSRKRARSARKQPRAAAQARRTGAARASAEPRRAAGLNRSRKSLRELDENIPTPPSSLDPDRRHASAARSGRQEMLEARREHTETSPVLTGGDLDADWQDAYAVGDEAPGGDNPTPDQDRVDDIGKALGVEYQDNEELRAADKISDRDRHRWELDPASSEDYPDRD
ncbi:MAG TPA: DUF6335 family protein [Vicinamibacterales bacterium]|nr:DUF6335 family protein [Vicinamibacterales bacterium]